MLLIIISIIVLTVLVILQKSKKTKSLYIVFERLRKGNPLISAITFGWIPNREMYKNVYSTNDGKFEIKYESYPVTETGDPILQNTNHGIVTEYRDGFSIQGVNKNQKFQCPEGYTTANCVLEPICSESDSGKIKGLKQAHFWLLNLYNYKASGLSSINRHLYHQKLKVSCLNAIGDYSIVPCEENEIVTQTTNDSINCKRYDICQDRLNGFVHNYKITDTQSSLKENEYYRCLNGTSVFSTCDNSFVFSNYNKSCIPKNVCFGKDYTEISVDKNNYIQCEKDIPKNVKCPHGTIVLENHLRCKISTCIPMNQYFEDNVLKYIFSRTTCSENDETIDITCDVTHVKKKIYIRFWFTD